MKIYWFLDFEVDRAPSLTSRVEMAKALSALGNTVELYGRYRNDYPQFFETIAFHPLRQIPIWGIRRITALLSAAFLMFFAVAMRKPEVIYIDRASMVIASIPSSFLTRIRVFSAQFVLDVRSPPLPRKGIVYRIEKVLFVLGMRWAGIFYDGITTINHSLRELVIQSTDWRAQRIGLWTSAVPESFLSIRGNGTVDDEQLLLINHGTFSYTRALEELVHAIRIASQRLPYLTLTLLGGGSSSSRLQKLIREFDMEEHIFLKPAIPYERVPFEIAKHTAGINPLVDNSWFRVSSPLKVVEYLALGKPVLISDIEAHRRILGDSEIAFYIPSIEPESIAETILRFSRERSKLSNASGKARSIVREHGLTWEIQATALEAYFLDCLDANTSGPLV